ncbi:MAG: hypothetical protein JXB30_11740 [Anaerolineae bacterium]|nr:hypothetical protein [Anaerolineae bacterium]
MLDWYSQERHWSPCQTYATGDVVMNMISQGWRVKSVQDAPDQSPAKLHIVNLCREEEDRDLLVLDGPAIRDIAMKV